MRLYFAYGSNMSSRRLRERLPEPEPVGAARLDGKRFACNKRGRDGTAKANLVDATGEFVWGVLWRVESGDWPRLDRFEGGYERVEVQVETRDGGLHLALTYVSAHLAEEPVPSESYRRWLLEGAREHGLPAEWLAGLERLPARPDPRHP